MAGASNTLLGSSGVWELFVPGLDVGAMYKFEIITATGQRLVKTDPLGLSFEMRPKTAAIVADPNRLWEDRAWMEQRKTSLTRPWPSTRSILGSWRRPNGAF